MLAPVVEQVAHDYQGKLKVLSANLEDAGDTASNIGIMSIPALVFFKGGKEVHRIVGSVPKQKIVDEIQKRLGV